jgi:hypothetical protein
MINIIQPTFLYAYPLLVTVLVAIVLLAVFGMMNMHKKRAIIPHPVTELSVKSTWGADCCDPVPPATSSSAGDSFARPLPEGVVLLKDFLSVAECSKIMIEAETHGFGTTPYPKSYRGNLRLTTADTTLAASLFKRINPFVPPEVSLPDGSEWEVCGLNESFRLSKYLPGDLFKTHVDGKFLRSPDEQSMFTVNAYLNGDFSGGSTRFYNDERDQVIAEIKPKAGGPCLIFRQPPGAYLPHDGEKVTKGEKYLLRSDVMYRRKVSILLSTEAEVVT